MAPREVANQVWKRTANLRLGSGAGRVCWPSELMMRCDICVCQASQEAEMDDKLVLAWIGKLNG